MFAKFKLASTIRANFDLQRLSPEKSRQFAIGDVVGRLSRDKHLVGLMQGEELWVCLLVKHLHCACARIMAAIPGCEKAKI